MEYSFNERKKENLRIGIKKEKRYRLLFLGVASISSAGCFTTDTMLLALALPQRDIFPEVKVKACRQRRTLPHSRPCSTIRACELNDQVRDGTGWTLTALTTHKFLNL